MRQVVLVGAMVGLRVAVLLYALSLTPDDGRTALGNDARRFLEISDSEGVPYRDFEVEVPPLALLTIEGLARDAETPKDLAVRLVWLMLACELATTLILARAWDTGVALSYLLLGTPVALFVYFRLDLLSVLLAVSALAFVRRSRDRLGALFLVAGAFAKVWPLFLAPAMAVRGRWTAFRWTVTIGAMGGLAWILLWGLGGPAQVLTFRGATGWGIESTIGLPMWAFTDRQVRFESGAFRIGTAPISIRVVLVATLIAVMVWVWGRATPSTAEGAASVAVLAALLLLSPHTSPQWLVWLFPFIAISTSPRLRLWGMVGGAASAALYLAATRGGETGSTFAFAAEFVRLLAIAALFIAAVRQITGTQHASEEMLEPQTPAVPSL